MKKMEEYIGIGRRKTAVASVRLRSGSGSVKVNGRNVEDYFLLELQRNDAFAPIKKVASLSNYDIVIRVKGGGIEAQVTATQLGVARALVKQDETRSGEF